MILWCTSLPVGSIEVPQGDDLLLDCLVVDVDMDLVDGFQWYRNGIPLNETENVVNTTSSRLTVKSISNLDLGRYECTYDSELIRGNNVSLTAAGKYCINCMHESIIQYIPRKTLCVMFLLYYILLFYT